MPPVVLGMPGNRPVAHAGLANFVDGVYRIGMPVRNYQVPGMKLPKKITPRTDHPFPLHGLDFSGNIYS